MKLGKEDKKHDDKPREIPPAGSHLGYCYRVIDCGWCVYDFQGKPALKDDGQRRCRIEGRIDFELWPINKDGQYVTMSDGKPFSVSPGFMGWMKDKEVKHTLNSWRSEEMPDVETFLGQPAFITVTHKPYISKKTQKQEIAIEVTAVTPIPEMLLQTMKMPEMVNPVLSYSAREHEQDVFDKLPDWYKSKLEKTSLSYLRAVGKELPVAQQPTGHHSDDPGPNAPSGANMDDDIPF